MQQLTVDSLVLFSMVLVLGCAADPGSAASGDAGDTATTSAADTAPSVVFLAPLGGQSVSNPVTFHSAVTGAVTSVRYSADTWPLGSSSDAGAAFGLTYAFTALGARTILAEGLDAGGAVLAQAQIAITVTAAAADTDSGADTGAGPTRVFPIALDEPSLYLANYGSASSTASFGLSRSGGRFHAGCDVYWSDDDGDYYVDEYYDLNNNTPIYAVADGTVIGYYDFYQGTSALEVDHGDVIIRYGEVDASGLPDGLDVGSTVTAGQHIADMGDLDMSGSTWSMLHFELYSGELSGPLTDASNDSYLNVPDGNYQRRGDLLDCAPFLEDLLASAGGR